MEDENGQISARVNDPRRDAMKTPDDVSAMVRLKAMGWSAKRIAAELGCSRNTVKRWLRYGDWQPCVTPSRSEKLDGLSDFLAERFRRHAGNADVIRQELAAEKNIHVRLRTVERTVAPLRRELVAEARATVRFETRPGSSCRSILASGGLRSAVCRRRCSSSWRRSAIPAACTSGPSGMRSRRAGLPGWRAPCSPSAVFLARSCSTTPGR